MRKHTIILRIEINIDRTTLGVVRTTLGERKFPIRFKVTHL